MVVDYRLCTVGCSLPRDAFDPDYVPAFVAIIGPDGPVGYTTDVSIEEN